MSFQKGSRFTPENISDIPGPKTYDLPQGQPDGYKRGAFLEKPDRFSKKKKSNVPGPVTCKTASNAGKKLSAAKHASDARYAILLKKVGALQKVHADCKKAHRAEIEGHKSEAARLVKINSEQGERLDKFKKQNDIHESRIQEYRKSSAADQSELKELRIKLRMSEHERAQLVSKHEEGGEAKKAMQSLESRRKDELRERDRKIAELEKGVSAERRELLQSCVDEGKRKADEEARKSREILKCMQEKLDIANRDSQEARQALSSLRSQAENQKIDYAVQLDQYRFVLSRVAEEYGRLATTTVAASKHAALVENHTAVQLRLFRLERKLANSEGQVAELANLVRHTQEENMILHQQLRDSQEEATFYCQTSQEHQATIDSRFYRTELHELHCLEGDIHQCERDITISRETMAVQESALTCTGAICDLYHSYNIELLSEYSRLAGILEEQHESHIALTDEVARNSAERNVLQAELANAQIEIITGQRALADVQVSFTESREGLRMLQHEVGELKNQIRDTAASHKQALQREHDASQKLSAALHISKTAEEALKAELEQLHVELADLSRFQEAYYNLVDEAEALVARNNLAEEEAQNLSKFNAKILSNNNPAQRIVYVDRIRQELAEVKQKLLVCTRDRDTMFAANEDLQHEVMKYKSVVLPDDSKPRTNLTRVRRPVLTSQSINTMSTKSTPPCVASDASIQGNVLEHIPGDMTIYELI